MPGSNSDLADEALRLACDAGRIILESGGETYRSEDVVLAVASALGGIDADAFATPTGIIVSCQDATGRSLSMVRRIRKRQMNLDKLGRVTSWFKGMRISDFFMNIVGGAFAAGMAIASIQLGLGNHQDLIIIGAIMLLVPGVTIVNAIRDTIAGDLVAGIARGADAFISAAGISVGVGIALQAWLMAGRIAL